MSETNFRRQALMELQEALGRGKPITWKEFKDETIFKTWMSEAFNKFPKLDTLGMGGQDPDSGPDVIKFLKKHDPQNSSGPVKSALDIMEKAQQALESDKFLDLAKPLKQTLGGGLFGKLQQAAAASRAAHKVQKAKEEEQVPVTDIIAELIAAALEMCTPEDALIVSDLLDATEVRLIRDAYYGNGIYVSAKPDMPVAFVNAINELIPMFRIREKQQGA